MKILVGGRMRFAVVTLALLLAGCSEQWEGFVYPNKGNLQRSQAIGVYPSLEECRLAARRALADLFNDPQLARGDYECGLNCDDGRKHGGVKVCKKTER